MKSRIPLTQANLQYFAGVSQRKLTTRIDELLREGTLDIQIDDSEDVTYIVPGADRSPDGPTTPEAYERKRALVEEAKRRILARRAGKTSPDQPEAKKPSESEPDTRSAAKSSPRHDDDEDHDNDDDGPGIAGLMGKAALLASTTALVTLDKPLAMLDKPRGKGEKSLIASAGLSLLGPVGWLYAGSFREAVPATLAFAAAYYVLPSFLLAPFMFVGALASSAVGLGYAWQFNRKKGRTPLFLTSKKDKKKRGKKKKND